MSSEQATIEELEQKIAQLTKENRSLKAQLQIEIEKESLHQLTLAKIKQIHSEYESSYLSSLSDYKSREANLKNQYFQYQSMLENQYNQNEKRLNDQIEQMKNVIKSKDQTISQIIKQNKELKQIISKNEIEWHLKENEYENAIKIKERKIKELEDSIKTITKEAGEEFQKLSTQLDDFQNKIRNGALVENEEYGDDNQMSVNENNNGNDTIHTFDSSPYQVQQGADINNYNTSPNIQNLRRVIDNVPIANNNTQ